MRKVSLFGFGLVLGSLAIVSHIRVQGGVGDEPLRRIAFGSCCHQGLPAPVFSAILAARPQLFVWMGDNIYGDSEDMDVLARKYRVQESRPGYAALRDACHITGTWDDHDFGANDAGKEYPKKEESQLLLLDFLGESDRSPRRKRVGVYGHQDYGPPGKKTRLLLLDTRTFRDQPGPEGDVLGEAQWKWLEEALVKSDAQVHVLVSSIQVLASEHRFEKWADLPKAKARLLALLARKDVPPVLLWSGDRHLAEISHEGPEIAGYDLFEATSSSLNMPIGAKPEEVNSRRVGANFTRENFGTLTLDWDRTPVQATLCIRDVDGAPVRALSLAWPTRK